MKNKIIAFLLVTAGIISCLYSILIHSLVPGTFAETLTAFCNVWLLLGTVLIFLGLFRFKFKISFIKRMNRISKFIAALFFAGGITVSAINLIFICTPVKNPSPDAKYVILLGGGIDKNGKLPKTVTPRLHAAQKYLTENKNAIIVVTGGSLKGLPAEAISLKAELIKAGIPENRILMEDKALDTIQNFQYSCKMLSEYEACPKSQILQSDILIITSNFHLRRAQRLARRMGFKNFTGLGTKIPAINVVNTYSREICAYIKLNLRILLTGKPETITG